MPESSSSIPSNFDRIQPQLCINSKLRKLHRMLNAVYMAKFKPYGLGGSMLSILFIIGKKPGINQRTIAEMLVLDQSTMSRDLKKLVAKGWVELRKGQDARNSELFITEEGFELLEEVTPIWEGLQNNVQGILGSFNVTQIDNLISAIKGNLGELQSINLGQHDNS